MGHFFNYLKEIIMMQFPRPVQLVCFATVLATSAFPALAAETVDRQTETSIPRTANLYGIGVGLMPKTSGSEALRAMVLPIVQANFGERFYINALRAGVWLLDSDDRRLRFGLAADARFGWDADNSERTRGMRDRDFSVEIGPALRWQTAIGTVNAHWGFDAGGASRGQSVQLQFVRALIRDSQLRLNGMVGVTWSDRRMNNYYFGVTPGEATPNRPVYTAGAGTQWQAGVNGAYAMGRDSHVLFGLTLTRLGNTTADSPIVETRIQPLIYGGYAWHF